MAGAWWFVVGLGVGLALTAPALWLATRRTERRVRRAEKRARAAERLAELGTLTGGLAHEIKNPLSSVGLNIQLIQEDIRDLSGQATALTGPAADRLGRVQRRVDALWRETQRLREILEDFLRFAGRLKLDLAPTDVRALLEELTDFFGPQAQASQVRLRLEPCPQPAVARADPSLLKQALLNLMINATQAIAQARADGQPTGGDELILRIEHARPLGQAEIRIHVIDTGPGIPPERLDAVFQPYFSTKKAGTGLGLPTARRIIEEHGGSISIHSEPGKGSDFIVTVPAAEDPPAAG
jgi:signal transduction histidine kinase